MKIQALGILFGLTLAAACGPAQPKPPEVASSSNETGYALSFPTSLQGTSEKFGKDVEYVESTLPKLSSYPGQLDNPDWSTYENIIRTAEAEGRSEEYATTAKEQETVQTFFDEERESITSQVTFASTKDIQDETLKKAVSGGIAYSLKDAVGKRLEKRVTDDSEACALMEQNEEVLGRKNKPAIEKQVLELTELSYVMNIELPELRLRIEHMLDEVESVRKTLDNLDEAAQQAIEDGKKPTKYDEKRAAELGTARKTLSDAEAGAKAQLGGVDQKLEELKTKYDTAFEQLVGDIESRKK